MVSRGLRVGLGLALLSWLGLGLLDGGYGALLAPLGFESAGERLWFGALVLLSLLAPAVMLGLCQGALGLLVGSLARRLSRSSAPSRTAPWIGRLCALLCAPGVAAVCAQIFRGPRAQRIPGHDLWAVLIGVLALVALASAVQLVLSAVRWVDDAGPRRRRRSLLCGLPAAALAALCYAADLRVLPRLYPWFHLSLLALTLALGQVAALFLSLGATGLRRRWLNVAPLAPAVALLCALGGAWGLQRLDRAAVLRAAALEHTVLGARVLWLNARVHPGPELLPGAADAPAPGAAPLLGAGPRLPDTDVFLITVDALRSDRLAPATMPFSAGLAERGARFERAYTQVPHTSFAVATLLTGKPVYALLQLGQDAADHETLPTVLRRARYKTAAFYPPSVFFIEREKLRRLEESAYGFEYVKFEYLDAPRRTQQVIDFLEAERPERAFVWVHYLEPHEPYDVHPGGPGRAAPDRARYDGEVRFVDREIERLVTYVQKRRPGALVVLAADHGEEFGEHGGRYHGTTLYDEQVRVPLVFRDLHDPPRIPASRPQTPVGLIDVAPTILGLLDIAPSARMRGRDLGPLLVPGATAPPQPVFGEIGRKKMVVLGDHKLICDLSTDACALYDLAADPGERRNLYGQDAALTARLRGALGRFLGEASRFEREQAAAGLDGAGREALRRGRLGERAAAPGLARLIAGSKDRGAAAEATALLCGLCLAEGGAALCEGGAARAALSAQAQAPGDEVGRRWARVGLALGGDDAARAALPAIIKDEAAPAALRLGAALALGAARPGGAAGPGDKSADQKGPVDKGADQKGPAAASPGDGIDRPALWALALPAAMSLDDPERVRPLLQLLGRSRDPRALPALRAQLEGVRSRLDVVTAVGELGERGAVPDLARILAEDPYVPVRAAAATALGRLGGAAAREALLRAQRREREAQVLEAIRAALSAPPALPGPQRPPGDGPPAPRRAAPGQTP